MIATSSCRALAARCEGVRMQGPDLPITGLSADSRQVAPGFLFAALAGTRTVGSHFVTAALAAGAVAVLHDGSLELPASVAQFSHPNPRHALALLAAAFYGNPARQMRMVAITGTNGKTSTAAMVEAILLQQGERVGVIGTTGIRYPGFEQANPLTTPDPVALHRQLRNMADNRCSSVVMEVSSHALDQHRTAGIPWQVAVFTHLSRDHLDYHQTEQAYFDSKAALFLRDGPARAVIGIEEPWGQRLAQRCLGVLPVATFSIGPPVHAPVVPPLTDPALVAQPFYADDIALSWLGCRFRLHTPVGTLPVTLPGAGRFNVANALAAAATGWQLGIPEATIAAGLRQFSPAPGRMQTVQGGQPFAVVVDYAHTPDALERVLQTARSLTTGRIIAVFGCGGERDSGKRPLMGQVAARLAEQTIVTDDNPRSEDPQAIRDAIVQGCRQEAGSVEVLPDRAEAIAHAIAMADPGDAVIIAGKGHETVQITAKGCQPFDDVQTARHCLAAQGWKEVLQ
ncbi:MAG: UDP-N-acetylmuramoyl-L-alanyl-D-glutamate--2,6-diaminopimelate ligase [Magnetococcales bacterium]|nr:UDP-N-acetylmuramoyl-L-alanyl-D-glutamate--2,6-diaminopimelate ligase [Magnetococcales bacterium]